MVIYIFFVLSAAKLIAGQNVSFVTANAGEGEHIMSLTMHMAQLSAMKRDPLLRSNPVSIPKAFARVASGFSLDFSPCNPDSERLYRTADGSCNNDRRSNLGKSFERYKRYLPAQYDDGFCTPRTKSRVCRRHGCFNGICWTKFLPKEVLDFLPCHEKYELPSARTVSITVHPPRNVDSVNTVMLMQWGQFLDHDLTAAAIRQIDPVPICCRRNLVIDCSEPCFPIHIVQSPADRHFSKTCMEFQRSESVDEIIDRNNPREQKNLLTAFVDGSSVYGNEIETQKRLRDDNGRMKTSGDNLLPRGKDEDCIKGDNYCFDAGDDRVHVFPGLTALHLTFVRLHNRIVKELDQNTDWDDERLFQETRKIVIAILQRITYLEFLPEVLSKRTLYEYSLGDNQYRYNSYIDPSIASSFATAAFRFGHSLIPDFLVIDGERVISRELFNNPKFIFSSLKSVVRGVLTNPSESVDRFLSLEITDHLFESNGISFDLASFNIQRGRDHGLPPYNWFRKFCGLRPVTSFFSRALGSAGPKMSWIYRSVDDIDLFAGGLAEPPEDGSLLGPTFSCIIAKQFHDLKFGDSYWHETRDSKKGFTSDQLEEIRKTCLAKVLCEEIGLDRIQKNPFRVVSDRNEKVECESFQDFDLKPWYAP